jgi:hypothetical protein
MAHEKSQRIIINAKEITRMALPIVFLAISDKNKGVWYIRANNTNAKNKFKFFILNNLTIIYKLIYIFSSYYK